MPKPLQSKIKRIKMHNDRLRRYLLNKIKYKKKSENKKISRYKSDLKTRMKENLYMNHD